MRMRSSLLLALMLLAAPALCQAQIQGDIRFMAEREDAAWVGQEVELYLDLWSDGFSFGEQSFVLPEVKGGYLLQADSSTVKLSENRNGTQWQGLRYTMLFYPQRAGRLQVPAFDVRFLARGPFGTEPARFQFRTEPLAVEARMPPGADSNGLLVSSSSFSLDASWNPQPDGDGALTLKVGDALTLEVRRQAQDVPGMVFPPLPAFDIAGLGVYPDTPQVNDQINRGVLNGSRTDSVTFICETEGEFALPEMRFQWWDPQQEVLSERVIPGLELQVEANPAYAETSARSTAAAGSVMDWRLWVVVIAGLVALYLLIRYPGRSLFRRWQAYRDRQQAEREAGEPWAFEQLLAACRQNSPMDAYNAVAIWLSRLDNRDKQVSLLQMAKASGNEALAREAEKLQACLLSGSAGEWSGRELAQLLKDYRVDAQRVADKVQVLAPLNPA